MLTKTEVSRWTNDPVTVEFYKLLNEYKQHLLMKLECGEPLGSLDTHLDPSLKYARIFGAIEAVNTMLEAELTTSREDEDVN